MRHHTDSTPLEMRDGHEPAPQRRNMLPAVTALAASLAIAAALFMGTKALISSVTAEAPEPPAATATPEPEVAPEPERTRPVYASSGAELDQPAGRVIATVDGMHDMDISTYRDEQIANSLINHAEHILEPGNLRYMAFRDGGNRWWHEVVTTPESDGGPSLNDPTRYAEILDRWHAGDYSEIHAEIEWLRTPVGE